MTSKCTVNASLNTCYIFIIVYYFNALRAEDRYVCVEFHSNPNFSDLQMGQVLWRVARNQQLQQQYSEQCFLQQDGERGRRDGPPLAEQLQQHRTTQCQVPGTDISHLLRVRKGKEEQGFIDLEMLPPELSITILSYLNATELCLASCVWQDLGSDEYLWQGLVMFLASI